MTIHNSSELNNLSDQVVESVTDLKFVSECCNDLTSLNLNRFIKLETIEIGDDCFENVDIFRIDGLNELKSLEIGGNSFNHVKKDDVDMEELVELTNNTSRSFHLLNCIELESIEIESHSFCDYGGGFELVNLPKLSTIKMDSLNFMCSSFVIKGIIDDDNAIE